MGDQPSYKELEQEVKALKCLYGISKVVEDSFQSDDDIFTKIVQLIPRAWQYPDNACARINLNGREFKTDNFRQTKSVLRRKIVINGEDSGFIELCYLEDVPAENGDVFLKEENALLADITEEIAKFVEQRQTEIILQKYQDELELMMDQRNVELERTNEELKREIEERKRAEEAHRISDERYVIAVKAGGVGVWDWNIETNEAYLGANLKALIGYDDDEIDNQMDDWLKHVHPEDKPRVNQAVREYLDGNTAQYEIEYRMTHKKGNIRWFIVRGTLVRDENGKPVRMLGTNTDITERKILEENWRTYEFIVNAAKEFMTLIDINYVYRAANQAYCRAHGKILEDILGKTVENVWGKEAFEMSIKDHLDRCFAGEEVQYEAWFEFRNREKRCYNVTYYSYKNERKETTHAVVVSHDITRLKLAEGKLRDSRRRLRVIFDSIQAGIIIVDTNDYAIIDANPAATQIIGVKKEELIGSKCFQYFCQDRNGLCPIIDLNRTIDHAEHLLVKKDGSKIPIQTTVAPITLDGRAHLLESFVDISRLKEAEEKKRMLESQLQHMQKIQAIGTLAGGIAHDFNNILTPIMINTEVALLDIPEEHTVRMQLEEVLKAGRRARDLVKQILTFSRQGEQERTPLRVGPVLKESLKLLRASLPTTIEIRRIIKTESDLVLADPTQIHQVMMNLCTNAAQAMREKGGILEVSMREVVLDIEAAEHYPDIKPGAYLELVVSDTGHGMDKSVMDRIFDPYFTTRAKDEGTGLGLAVVHGIVTNHGGVITVESEPEKGSTFKILLPKIKEGLSAIPGTENLYPRGTERILLVDDERPIVEAVKLMLKRLGYDVASYTNPREALAEFENDPNDFDLVITDQTMPQMTGVEFSKKLLGIRPGLPVVLCTGYSELISEDKAKSMGIREFIMKPIVMDEIANIIRRVLD